MTDSLASIAAAYRALLTDAERAADDHSPGAIFWRAWRASMSDAPRSRAWKARALNLNPEPLHNAIALAGMAPLQWDDRWHLAVALPQPNPAGDPHAYVEDIVLIDPKTSRAHVMGDHGATHIAPDTAQRLTVHTDAKAWARDIALQRLEWYQTRRARRHALQVEPSWNGHPAAALILAAPSKVRWSDIQADIIEVPAELRRDVHRAVIAQARLPRIEGRA